MIKDLNEVISTSEHALFGVILFTELNPDVIKVLKDPDYFNALHEASGPSLTVFATMLFAPPFDDAAEHTSSFDSVKRVWKEPKANLELLETFGLNDSRSFPLFVYFSFEGHQLLYHISRIETGTPTIAYNSLMEIIQTACAPPDEHPSYESSRERLQWLKVKVTASRVFRWLRDFRGLFGV